MSYFPAPDSQDARAMLSALGLDSVEQLFDSIPADLRKTAGIDLPAGISEAELSRRFRTLAGKNKPLTQATAFVGGGSYPYPTVAAALYAISRGEFLTAYTPYQPEISQGTLTAIFEFQTWISELSGMDVANASMYDGASAAAEAALMGLRVRKKCKNIYISSGLHKDVKAVIKRYLAGQQGVAVDELPLDEHGRTELAPISTESPNVVVVGYPSGVGVIEDIAAIRAKLDEKDFLVVHTPDPHMWLLLRAPGALGADVVVSEGQPFGVPMSYGGPALGLFAAKKAYLRQMPGRLCGKTTDAQGRDGYVLTLSTREQHIRREKATSNICTNQGVIALLAGVSMAVLGPQGLRERALAAANNARRLEALLLDHGFARKYSAPYFNEFVVTHPDLQAIYDRCLEHDVQPGIPGITGDNNELLVCATAWHTDDDFERLQACLK